MSGEVNRRYELRRLTPIEWIILDLSRGENDPRRTVACIYEVDEFECDVIWLRDLDLRRSYHRPEDVLDAVLRATASPSIDPSRKPRPIPHRPPVAV